MKWKVSENIVCVHDEFKVTDKISLADYQDYSIKKFDSQMEKIANKHPKVVVAMSGGIDSSMVFSWCMFTSETSPGQASTMETQGLV